MHGEIKAHWPMGPINLGYVEKRSALPAGAASSVANEEVRKLAERREAIAEVQRGAQR